MQPASSHFRTLGILWILYALGRFHNALWLSWHGNALTLMFGALLNRVPNPFPWMNGFHFLLTGSILLSIVAGIVALIAGILLLAKGQSARTIGLVASFFGLTGGPLGIALGVFTVAILMPLAG